MSTPPRTQRREPDVSPHDPRDGRVGPAGFDEVYGGEVEPAVPAVAGRASWGLGLWCAYVGMMIRSLACERRNKDAVVVCRLDGEMFFSVA